MGVDLVSPLLVLCVLISTFTKIEERGKWEGRGERGRKEKEEETKKEFKMHAFWRVLGNLTFLWHSHLGMNSHSRISFKIEVNGGPKRRMGEGYDLEFRIILAANS